MPMPIEGKLLEILCCPVSKTPLIRLNSEKLASLNAAISRGEALYVNHQEVTATLNEALVTDDMKVIYEVRDDIPILLQEYGIGTTQFQDF